LRGSFGQPALDYPRCIVSHREAVVGGDKLPAGQEHVVVRTVKFHNNVVPTFWHRIDVVEAHTTRNAESKTTLKSWTKKSSKKVYVWEGVENSKNPGEDHWTTYRHQLEQFVNRIKKREGSGCWMDAEDSIRQMVVIDSARKGGSSTETE
jgi:hypothetical protein